MVRVLAERISDGRADLGEDELHHLTRVLRQREGDAVEVIAPEGGRYRAVLRRDGSEWFAEILAPLQATSESPIELVLAQALIKKDKFEWVIQKAVELGAGSIVPLITRRTEVRLDEKRAEKKQARWEKILAEAVKQCGRDRVPSLSPPTGLAELLKQEELSEKLFFDEAGVVPLSEDSNELAQKSRLVLLIGPEGGWDPLDRETILAAERVHPIRLGPRILRSETASVTALAIVQYLFGDLGRRPPQS